MEIQNSAEDRRTAQQTTFTGESQISPELIEELVDQLGHDLEPISPRDGIERFLSHKRPEVTSHTLEEYDNKLSRVEEFLDQQNITSFEMVDGRLVDDYISWLRYEASDVVDELSRKTMRDEMYLLRDLLRHLEKINGVQHGLSESVEIPDLPGDEGVRNVDLDPERVVEILDYLETFEYATLRHAIWILLVKLGRRLGGYLALDVQDVHLEGRSPYIEFCNRPPETRLKNGDDSEDEIAISDAVAEVLDDFIAYNRPEVTDDYGREPLLATNNGRIAKSTFRRYVYDLTQPCTIGNECPHGRSEDECDAAQSLDKASTCPSSRSPHALRHGYLTEGRRRGIPIEVLSDRCDVSGEVIKEVYDETSPSERREARRDILDEYTSENGGGYL